jgi:hypothetical protein
VKILLILLVIGVCVVAVILYNFLLSLLPEKIGRIIQFSPGIIFMSIVLWHAEFEWWKAGIVLMLIILRFIFIGPEKISSRSGRS